jgi:transcriptional regulator with XRE-family HTH domain
MANRPACTNTEIGPALLRYHRCRKSTSTLSEASRKRQQHEKDLQRLRGLLEQKSGERDRVLALFRRGRIDDATLDKQLDEINAETIALTTDIDAATRALSSRDQQAQLNSAETLLETLRKRLDKPISHELRRRIIETLVESVRANTVERWGVQQSQITVTYRFAEPNERAAAILPLSHHLTNRARLPEKLETVGDHIRRRRLTLKLLQRQVAEQLGVDKTSIYNWEGNRAKPGLEYMPAIIRFLGYNPLPPADGWADRLVQCRTVLGLSQKESAHRIGVDPCTLARWERGEREPTGSFAARALRFLTGAEAMWSQGAAQTA